MKIGIIRCLLIILSCAQLLMVMSFVIVNNMSTSIKRNLNDQAVTTVLAINPTEEDGTKARVDHEVKYMVVVSKKSQGKKGSGGGNNVVCDPSGKKKNDVVSKLPQTVFSHRSLLVSCSYLSDYGQIYLHGVIH